MKKVRIIRKQRKKSSEKQDHEKEVILNQYRKKCYICKDWIELGEKTYCCGHPMPVYRHTNCARSVVEKKINEDS